MPVVRYGSEKVGTAPLPGVRRTAAETPLSEGAGLADAQGQTAETVAGVGGALARIGTQAYSQIEAGEREHADNVAVLSGNKQRDDYVFDTVLDPATGALATTKGKDALGLVQTVIPAFDQKVQEIAGGLNDRQRDAFLRQSLSARESLRTTLDNHGSKEAEIYADQETEGAATTKKKMAVATIVDNPLQAGQELAGIDAIWNQYADRKGLGPEARQALLDAKRTDVHVDAIDALLARGQDRNAQHYYEQFKDQITGDQLPRLEAKLQAAGTDGTGLRASEVIWGRFAPKTDDDPIELDKMENAARAQFADDPKALRATINFLREKKQGFDAGRKEREEANAGNVWRAVIQGVSPGESLLQQVQTMPAYLALPGRTQAQISDHIVQQAQARADRSYTLSERDYATARRAEADKEQAGWAMRWHYDDPRVLSQMSEDQVLALTPDLGMRNVNELLEKRRAYAASADKLRKATIDDDLFKSLAAEAGLRAYAAGGSNTAAAEQRKSELGQLRNTVEAAIADEQGRRGAVLTRGETQKVMQGVLDHHIMVKNTLTPDATHVAAAVVNARDKANSYVPVDQIPQNSLNEWVNVIRANFPREQQRTRDEIIGLYRDRIQRAHAASVLGLGGDEELRRLQGR